MKMPLGPAELRSEERIDKISRHRRSNNPAAHTDDVHMVVFNSLPGREVIVNQPRSEAQNLLGTDYGTDAAAANCYRAPP